MAHAQLTELTPKWLARMRSGSEADAPWSRLSPSAWRFIEHALEVGLQWKTPARCLDRWLVPETNTERRRQQTATREPVLETLPPFSAAIGLVRRHYLGGETGHGWEGGGESYYAPAAARPPDDFEVLARAISPFWPDMPALLWEQVRSLLSVRTHESDQESFGGTSDYAVDNIDAVKLFRFLDSHGKTHAVQLLMDWKRIIDPAESVIGVVHHGPRAVLIE